MACSATKLAYEKPNLETIEFDEDVILTSDPCAQHQGCVTLDTSSKFSNEVEIGVN